MLCQLFIVWLGGWWLNVVKPQRNGLGHRYALPPATQILRSDKGLVFRRTEKFGRHWQRKSAQFYSSLPSEQRQV